MTAGPLPNEVAPGTMLAGKYRVERVIGRGGMGVVVEARHMALDERVALKLLLPELATHVEAPERFLREARAAVRIKSAHVARVSDVGVLESGAPYMVMEYLEGWDAGRLLEASGPLPVSEAIDFIIQACDAISEAHAAGIVHRDLKPANLFVARHPDGTPFVKVLDFGISKIIDQVPADALTRTNATLGSALYMSPEQIRHSKSVDRRTDVYALGITLYEFLTCQLPFSAESFAALCVEIVTGTPKPLKQLRPELPVELSAVIEKAFANDMGRRYASVAELVVALAPWAPPRSQPIVERIARAAGLLPGSSAGRAPSAPGTPTGAGAPVSSGSPVSFQASADSFAAAPASSTHLDAATTLGEQSSSRGRRWLFAGGLAVVAVAGAAYFLARGGAAGGAPEAAHDPAKSPTGETLVPAVVAAPVPAEPKPAEVAVRDDPKPGASSAPVAAAPVAVPTSVSPPNAAQIVTSGGAKSKVSKPTEPKRPVQAPPNPKAPASPPASTRSADEYR